VSLLHSRPPAGSAQDLEKSAVKKVVDPDGKWNATMQLAVTALLEVGGDLSCIGHNKALH
jgi:hypothetical protein